MTSYITPPKPDGVRQSTVQRLFTDLREVQEYKLQTISALPLEDNLLEWHCNLKAHESTPYNGGLFHLILRFPQDYPDHPPSLDICTSIPHKNVFGRRLCLDMLSDFEGKYQGWSSSYSALSILLQLQSFLFKTLDEDTDYAETIQFKKEARAAVQESKSYECPGCHHRPGRPWPPVEKADTGATPTHRMTLIRQQLKCYYSRRTFEEDCLGVGLSVNRNIRTGRILSITSPLDLVSLRSYMRHKVRKSAYNEAFSHWIPVYISAEHAKKAIPMARNAMSTICTGTSKKFDPAMALEILPGLMRSMVVEMLLDRIHVSTKSLTGFCWFFRMLVQMMREHPEIPKLAREKILAALSAEQNRDKDAIPDLGTFLATWIMTDIPWEEMRPAILQERFDRDVFWILRKYPELGKLDVEDEDRATKSFVSSTTSLRHVLFFANIARFVRPIQVFAGLLDENLGELPVAVEDDLMRLCHSILAVNSYDDFFRTLGEPVPSKERLNEMLRQSVMNSQRRGYHEKILEVTKVEDAVKQEQEKIRPLESYLVPAPTAQDPSAMALTSDERVWQKSCLRFGIKHLPEGTTWRELYLRMNLQELVQKLNDSPDFTKLHKIISLSAPYITTFEWVTFFPDRIQSRYYFLMLLLTHLPNLREFKITRHSVDLHPNACKAITRGLKYRPDALRSLDISMTNANPDALIELLPGLLATTQLRTLNLSFNRLSGHQKFTKLFAKLLRRHPTLEVLKMNSCSLTDNEAFLLAPSLEFHTTLRQLEVQRNKFSASGLGQLLYNVGFIPTVTHVDCSANQEARGRTSGAQLSPGDAMARMCEISVSLVAMNCWKTPFTYSERFFDALAHNRSLNFLDLGDTQMPNEFAPRLGRALLHNNTLKELNLERNNLSMHAFYQMCKPGVKDARGFSVEVLKMNGNDLSQSITIEKRPEHTDNPDDEEDEGSQVVLTAADMLRVFKRLRVLELKASSLNESSGAILGGLLEVKPGVPSIPIERLFLAHNLLGPVGTASIAASLKTNMSLRCLDLSSNRFGVTGARAIAAVLRANHPLEELNLFANLIGVEGCREIAFALPHNTHLKVLDLGMNRIRDKGACALAQMLRTNTTLQCLKLRLNLIGARGAHELLAHIVTLDASVLAGPASAAAQGDAMSVTSSEGERAWGNKTMRQLLLNNNPIPNEAIMLVCKALADSKHPLELDLLKRLAEADPERRQFTVWVSPLPQDCSSDELARFFYANSTGAIRNITICQAKKRRGQGKGKGKRYAFVEFVDENSVELALHLPPQDKAFIRDQKISIARSGVRSGRSVDLQKRQENQAARRAGRRPAPVRRSREGRGARRRR